MTDLSSNKRFHRNSNPGQKPRNQIGRFFHRAGFIVLSLLIVAGIPSSGSYVYASSNRSYPILTFNAEERALQHQTLVITPQSTAAGQTQNTSKTYTQGSAFSLLSRMYYIPSERDQTNSGTCWIWAGTGIMEIALNVQLGFTERLSIQYFDSNYNGGYGPDWAGNGGLATDFANFYNSKKMIIPWSNKNADFQDQNGGDRAAVPASAISTTPNYLITSVTATQIQTYGIGSAAAISNIKNILNQNKAIYFGFHLANETDWEQFSDFWNTQPESAIWNHGFSDGKYYDVADGAGGHGVICVGYDDSDPNPGKHYWIMLNSYGPTAGRPNGLFRIPMEYNYNSTSSAEHTTEWWTIDPVYSTEVSVPKAPSAAVVPSIFTNPKNVIPCFWQ